jgi:hypothetical protein
MYSGTINGGRSKWVKFPIAIPPIWTYYISFIYGIYIREGIIGLQKADISISLAGIETKTIKEI